LADRTLDDAGRVRAAYRKVVNRAAPGTLIDDALRYVRGFPGGEREAAWTSLVRTMIASNEFLYVH
jgi:hypothetical protein